MKLFANWLSGQVGRVVIDKTGLAETYYFTLEWTPDEGSFPGTAEQETTSHNQDGAAVRYPSLFKALQEELGLKLEPQHGLTDVIVIDHIGQPSEN